MGCKATDQNTAQRGPLDFTTTHWSVVLAATDRAVPEAQEAMEKLCRAYWRPLYAYVLRQGHPLQDAQDLTQKFFARFLEKNYVAQADREKGRFRSFLLASMKHFLANEWDRANTLKRGGSATFIPWEEADHELQAGLDTHLPPDRIYERQWALTVLDQVFACLREECAAAGKAELFGALRIYLSGEKSTTSYADAAGPLKFTSRTS